MGEKIPLALKLYDNRPDMKVRADIFNMFGELLNSIRLHHTQSGLYINTDLPMPDLEYILVTYTVEDSEDYESICERFDGVKKQENDKWIYGQVDEMVKSSEFITGVIVDETTNI